MKIEKEQILKIIKIEPKIFKSIESQVDREFILIIILISKLYYL